VVAERVGYVSSVDVEPAAARLLWVWVEPAGWTEGDWYDGQLGFGERVDVVRACLEDAIARLLSDVNAKIQQCTSTAEPVWDPGQQRGRLSRRADIACESLPKENGSCRKILKQQGISA